MKFTLENQYSPSLWDSHGEANEVQGEIVTPFEAFGKQNLARIRIFFETSSPGGTRGLAESQVVDLILFQRGWGTFGAGVTSQLTPQTTRHYRHHELDVRDRAGLAALFRGEGPFDLIIHCAAQPSHDLAASRAFDDFDVNAGGTMNLLEATKHASPDAVFVLMSTNKVYGDAPNELPLVELERRWDYARAEHHNGIDETMRVDQSKHSLFGASKLAADVMTQEYGRYFGMKTHCLRGGCLTGPHHSGVELHGFLSYLVKTQLSGGVYRVFGYKGKQVRDNIHCYDVARAVEAIAAAPRCGEVYNLGGGRDNACSILEAFDRVEQLTGRAMRWEYVDQHRQGDHICYISDLSRFRGHYPSWDLTKSLDAIFQEIIDAWYARLRAV